MNGSHASTGFCVGGDFRVRCMTYAHEVPILTIDAPGVTLAVSPSGRAGTGKALEFARDLLREVGVFAAEIERLHAVRPGSGEAA